MTVASLARRLALASLTLLGLAAPAAAQRPPEQLDAGEILHRMQKLGVLGSVLYVAAHPDDENTRLISWLSNGRKVRAAYLSLTRGDGGQNLIGPELGDALGVIRTQELLEARRIDGGEQFFTRAVDFGYSKSPEEALAKWGHDEVLADVVRVFRTFRPDVVVTRFPTDGGGGHGHHTASALLAQEAFTLAADPSAFPEQLAQGLQPWQPERLFLNAGRWWNPDIEEDARNDPAHWVAVDVGGFDPLLGASYSEIAGKSRSQHKSQGFGAAETRGEQLEYLGLEQGTALGAPDLLDGVDLGWTRVAGGEPIGALVDALVEGFEPRAPEESLDELADLVRALDALAASGAEGSDWARRKAEDARELALQLAGVVVEASAQVSGVARGGTLEVSLSAIQRSPSPALELVEFVGPDGVAIPVGEPLPPNRPLEVRASLAIDAAQPIDEPYWLAAPHGTLYRPRTAGGDDLHGTRRHGIEPRSTPSLVFQATLRLPDGLEVRVSRPLMRTWVDRVDGQRTRPVVVTPLASIEPADSVAIVTGERIELAVAVEALPGAPDPLEGTLRASAPEGWTLEEPSAPEVSLHPGERARLVLGLRRTPGATPAPEGELRLALDGPQGSSQRTQHVIDYPHILPQTWYSPAEVRLVPLDVAVSVHTVGYVEGAGDDVPRALALLGVTVERIDPAVATRADLDRLDALVTGIRAYNTVPALARFQRELLEWVEAGGTLLVQYNTAGRDLLVDPRQAGALGPYPFALTRGRVTVEEAPATLLVPEHPLLTTPNRLGAADFEGWVQERGLYFAGELDPHYTPLVAWSDPGEAPLDGALVTCEWGKGRFTYTGISLFRQLPAGVPGAYRLLANLIARRSSGE